MRAVRGCFSCFAFAPVYLLSCGPHPWPLLYCGSHPAMVVSLVLVIVSLALLSQLCRDQNIFGLGSLIPHYCLCGFKLSMQSRILKKDSNVKFSKSIETNIPVTDCTETRFQCEDFKEYRNKELFSKSIGELVLYRFCVSNVLHPFQTKDLHYKMKISLFVSMPILQRVLHFPLLRKNLR